MFWNFIATAKEVMVNVFLPLVSMLLPQGLILDVLGCSARRDYCIMLALEGVTEGSQWSFQGGFKVLWV